jgi:hypothetical protein
MFVQMLWSNILLKLYPIKKITFFRDPGSASLFASCPANVGAYTTSRGKLHNNFPRQDVFCLLYAIRATSIPGGESSGTSNQFILIAVWNFHSYADEKSALLGYVAASLGACRGLEGTALPRHFGNCSLICAVPSPTTTNSYNHLFPHRVIMVLQEMRPLLSLTNHPSISKPFLITPC